MADLHTYKKLPSDPCLTEEQITAYIDGKLSVAEQHACEKHILDCEMCEDAVEGIALVKDRSVLATPLKSSEAPIETQPSATGGGKVIPLQQPRRIAYAAAAVLVLILGCTFLFKMMSDNDEAPNSELAYNENAAYDSTGAPLETYPADAEKSVAQEPSLKNENKPMQTADGQKEGPKAVPDKVTSSEETPTENVAPEIAMDESPAVTEEQEQLAVADYDLQDGDQVLSEKAEDLKVADGKDKAAEQEKEKKNLVDIAKSGLASGGVSRSETQKRDAYVDDNRNNNVPASPQTTVTNNATVTSGNVFTMTPAGQTITVADSVSVVSANGAVAANDTASVDQLELSYQNGVNLLNAGQTSSAIVMFDKVIANKNHARYEDAEFQKANALIKANRKEEAKTLLKSIEAKKGKHSAEATDLLKSL